MKWKIALSLFVLLLLIGCTTVKPQDQEEQTALPGNYKTAIFAGGCFWCMEAPFEAEPGVLEVVAGYVGGSEETANYQDVSTGTTQHREGIRVYYDPSVVDYARLVELYFWQIDPTDPDGQFADKGYQYTTAVYYFDDEQQQAALDQIQVIEASGMFDKPVVTKVLPAQPFYLAEDYHQDYYKKQSAQYNTYATLSGRKGFIKKFWGQ